MKNGIVPVVVEDANRNELRILTHNEIALSVLVIMARPMYPTSY